MNVGSSLYQNCLFHRVSALARMLKKEDIAVGYLEGKWLRKRDAPAVTTSKQVGIVVGRVKRRGAGRCERLENCRGLTAKICRLVAERSIGVRGEKSKGHHATGQQ
jgi:hypothetical protein